MNHKTQGILKLLAVALIIAALAAVSLAGIGSTKWGSASNIKLGLDLAGGVSITYETVKEEPTEEELEDTRYKLAKRVEDQSTEANVYIEGSNRINVDIPGVKDAESILDKLGRGGEICFIYGAGNIQSSASAKSGYVLSKSMDEIKAAGDVILTGADIQNAEGQIRQINGINKNVVILSFNAEGTAKFATATSNSIGQAIAIVYDGEVISAPRVNEAITDGSAYIEGQSTLDEARLIASTIRIGALPIELRELSSNIVSAQLGQEAVTTSLIAAAVGLLLVILFMCIWYRVPGVAASLALCIYSGLIIIVMNLLDVTLTLPGMAGIILSIGMAVDANVIIFQRIREEIATGKTARSSIKIGFDKATSAIVDGNVTTLIAAAVLYAMAPGTIKGFAITLAIGTILSMFTALFVTRQILTAFYEIGFDDEKFYGIQKDRQTISFTKHAPKFAAIVAVVVVACVLGLVIGKTTTGNSLNYGLDFVGGTSMEVTIDNASDNIIVELEDLVFDTAGVTATINRVAGENIYRIKTVEISNELRMAVIDELVEKYGVDSSNIEIKNISGTISGEMKSDAVLAVVVAGIAMLVYIWIRFKNLGYASSAVIALLHDVVVVLAVYAVARISVGNTFIACMLTIVGYSINATIVVFDRLRENMKNKQKKESVAEIVNKSITQTVSRSINTSLTTLIMVVSLVIFGVESIREFAVPLMVGIIAGAFSSVCLSGVIWYYTGKLFKRAE